MLRGLIKHIPGIKGLVEESDRWRDLYHSIDPCDRLPVPPPELRNRVAGFADHDKFLGVGRVVYGDLKWMLARAGRPIDSYKSILDFGCGCGRVLRYFRPNGGFIAGSDVDAEAVEWCSDNLTNVDTAVVNDPCPPMKFADATFDLIIAISVFTHFPKDIENAWLDELRRLLQPGGTLVATVLGEADLKLLAPEEVRQDYYTEGFCYHRVFNSPGPLPDFYQISFHTRSYVEARWSHYFNIVAYHPQGINNHQDAVVCTKPA